jgi:hypothetical protein
MPCSPDTGTAEAFGFSGTIETTATKSKYILTLATNGGQFDMTWKKSIDLKQILTGDLMSKPREFTLEFGFEGQLLWPPNSPTTKVSHSIHVIEYSAYEKLKEENDKLIRLLSGEEVELECKNPGHRAVIKLDLNSDQAVLTESWHKDSDRGSE